jgi:hypothetical protein
VPYNSQAAQSCGCGSNADASSAKHPCDDYCSKRAEADKDRRDKDAAEKKEIESKALKERDETIKQLQSKIDAEQAQKEAEK